VIGPGKYDDVCSEIRERLQATGVIIIVFAGSQGSGFSCQAPPDLTLHLPAILETIAAEIRRGGIDA
jgi:hypothetical protein